MEQSKASSEQMYQILRDQIDASNNSPDPVTYITDLIWKFKETGLVGKGEKGEDKDIAAMRIDLEKWKTEKEIELRQWTADRQDRKEARKDARTQMEQVGKTLRQAIQEVGRPIADGFKEGLKDGFRKGPQAQRAAPPQAAQDKPLEQLTDEELTQTVKEYQRAKQVVGDAGQRIKAELERRGSMQKEPRPRQT